jgi:hypothetical protein
MSIVREGFAASFFSVKMEVNAADLTICMITSKYNTGFEVFTAVTMENVVF